MKSLLILFTSLCIFSTVNGTSISHGLNNQSQNAPNIFDPKSGRLRLLSGKASSKNKAFAATRSTSRGIYLHDSDKLGPGLEGDHWALIIGVNEYEKWGKLETAVNDARAVQKILIEKYRFDADRIKALYDHEATRRNILASLREMGEKLTRHDSLLVYYAGHGHLDKITGYWIPVDALSEVDYIPNSTIRDIVRAMEAKHVLLVADSCFAGSLFSRSVAKQPEQPDKKYLERVSRLLSRQIITSGNLEPVTDRGYDNHSIFGYYFLKALRENQEPLLSASSLFSRIQIPVSRNAVQTPICKPLQNAKDEGGEFIFIAGAPPVEIETSKQSVIDDRKAVVTVQSKPSGADIYLNDRFVGSTPHRLRDLNMGLYRITILKPGYVPYRKKISITAPDPFQLDAHLKKKEPKGSISILSEPGGANVYLNKTFMGKTPCRISNLDVGTHQLLVEKEGYAETHKTLSVLEDKDIELRFKMVPRESFSLRPKFTGEKIKNHLGMEFVLIPVGSFIMGSDSIKNESPRHPVKISRPFFMQVSEVTQNQWESVMGHNPSNRKTWLGLFDGSAYKPWESLLENPKELPVVNVTWDDCQRFIARLNTTGEKIGTYRLPTEAEWEFACQAGTETPSLLIYSPDQLEKYAWFSLNSGGRAHPVMKKTPNPWGLFDIYGNVSEWCSDNYGTYLPGSQIDPAGPRQGIYRVHRGGNFNLDTGYCRSSVRGFEKPGDMRPWLGLRLVVEPRTPVPENKQEISGVRQQSPPNRAEVPRQGGEERIDRLYIDQVR